MIEPTAVKTQGDPDITGQHTPSAMSGTDPADASVGEEQLEPMMPRPPSASTLASGVRELRQFVASALELPLQSCCMAALNAGGYALSYGSPEPLIEIGGTDCSLPLGALGLSREFWMRYVEWPDGFAISDMSRPLEALKHLWRGLYGLDPPPPWHWHAVKVKLLHLTPIMVGQAMYTTAWRTPELHGEARSLYFMRVANSSVAWMTGARRPTLFERQCLATLVPPDMRRDKRIFEPPKVRARRKRKARAAAAALNRSPEAAVQTSSEQAEQTVAAVTAAEIVQA